MRSRLYTAIALTVLAASPVFANGFELLRPAPAPEQNPQTQEKIELGRKLFFDRRLSGDGTMSCATCHAPERAFTDGLEISQSQPGTKNWRNAPTLMNVGFRKYLFHDGRSLTLEDQALFPVMSAFEMNRNLDFLEEAIRAVPGYVESFQTIFGGEPTRERITMAIAAFERTLVSRNTPLDRHLRGDKTALSDDAKKGLVIFAAKGKCIECHFGVSLSDDRFYALNVPENPAYENDPGVATTRRFVAKLARYEDYRGLNEDPGRYLVTKDGKDWKAFRTPTLLELSRTAPYMHNGVFPTLDDVIEFFDKGGGRGNTALKPLNLSDKEKKHLKAFLIEALTGEDLVVSNPNVPH